MTKEFLDSELILKIAGRGTPRYLAELRKLVADHKLTEKVRFVGQVEGDEKQKLLADAFWTIMPSHTENFGLVVLESLAQNTPVIASKGSPWEVLETEKLGFWVDNSPEELSRTLRKIVTMGATDYKEYRRRGRAFVTENFDIRRNIQKWVEIYRGLS